MLEGRILAHGRAHGKIPGHFIRQLKCCLANHHYLKPGHPTPGLRGKLIPPDDCLEIIDQVHFSRPDLLDQSLTEPEWKLYTDESSFIEYGHWWVGYVVLTIDKVIEAQTLAMGTSAQKAELRSLTRALELSQGKNVNFYTDSKCAFIFSPYPWCNVKGKMALNLGE